MPKPPPVPPTKKRKRVIEEPPVVLAPKPLLSGAVPLEAFLATLQKVGDINNVFVTACSYLPKVIMAPLILLLELGISTLKIYF